MSFSPNSNLVRRTIDLNYANKKRANSLKWSVVNGAFLLLFAYDLSCKCPGYTTILHYVEYVLVAVLGANLLQHSLHLLPRRATVVTLTSQQQHLLGLADTDLDSSFRVLERSAADSSVGEGAGGAGGVSDASSASSASDVSDALSASASLALSPARAWRSRDEAGAGGGGGGAAGGSPPPARTSSSPRAHPPHPAHAGHARDQFIADRLTLVDYLKEYEERSRLEAGAGVGGGAGAGAGGGAGPPAAPHYQLASLDTEGGKSEEGSPQGSPQVWWRLHLDPQRLTQWNLNLRLWIHVTILERLVREMDAIDDAFARQGLADVRLGQVSVERLRQLAAGAAGAAGAGGAGGAAGALAALPALLPFLEPFADQQYAVRRVRELARGGCLSAYRWARGGGAWHAALPADAELLLHLVATYLDAQLPGGARPFSAAHLSARPAPRPPRPPRTLVLHRALPRPHPPHYVLALDDDTLEVERGRNNLLHTLLLFLAAAARREPPALGRVHLGRAGLNMLWIIGR